MIQTMLHQPMSAEDVPPQPAARDVGPGWAAELIVDDPKASLRDIARRRRSRIVGTLDLEVTRGTTFHFWLPAASEAPHGDCP